MRLKGTARGGTRWWKPWKRRRRPVRPSTVAGRFGVLLLRLVAGFYAFCFASLLLYRFVPPPLTALELQRGVEALFGLGEVGRHRFVPLERISPHLAHAVIVAEDARFFEHNGVDWEALRQAVEDNVRRGRLWRGGSTITQQLVKNLFLGTRGGILRKLVELPLAVLADLLLPKKRILELYLNVVEWGPGVYGAERAARYHYGEAAAQLDRDRASRLAACLPAPRHRRPQEMGRIASVIRRRMIAVGW